MAITIGKYFEVEDLSIKEALESYIPENNRSQLLTKVLMIFWMLIMRIQ
jgi:UDP-N-acetylmuramoyl-tripeptide--D-alanyl-D-alanine ligase